MRRPITINDLSHEQILSIESWISNIKSTIEIYAGRSLDDLDELIGLLATIASHHSNYLNYSKAEMIGSIVEQFSESGYE